MCEADLRSPVFNPDEEPSCHTSECVIRLLNMMTKGASNVVQACPYENFDKEQSYIARLFDWACWSFRHNREQLCKYFDSARLESWIDVFLDGRLVCEILLEELYRGKRGRIEWGACADMLASLKRIQMQIDQLPEEHWFEFNHPLIWVSLTVMVLVAGKAPRENKGIDIVARMLPPGVINLTRMQERLIGTSQQKRLESVSTETRPYQGASPGLNPTEQAIIDTLAELGAVNLETLKTLNPQPIGAVLASKAANRKYDGQFKGTLSSMRKSGLLDNGRYHGQRRGYFLTKQGLAKVSQKSGPSQD